MSSATAPASRTGPALPAGLPAGARSAVRGAARAVAATVGAVLAGLVLALPGVHLPLTAASTGPQSAVVSSVHHSSFVAPAGLLSPVVVRVPAAPDAARSAPSVAALATAPVPGAAWVLLAAALVGLSRPLGRRTSPRRPPHHGPAPLRGPPAPLAPAP